jgi:O-antigen/teichoic acid export membrane protein
LNKANEKFTFKEIFQAIWGNSKKTGLVALGVFGMTQANILIAGQFIELKFVAQLGLCMQLFTMLQNFSRLYFSTYMPRFNNLRILNKLVELKKDFFRSMKIGWCIYFLGFIIIFSAGDSILSLINSRTLLPSQLILCLFGIMYLMEITHGNCAVFITTKNTVPFLGATLYTSTGIVLLSLLFVAQFKLEILSFPLATIICQCFYNAWKWPLEVIKDFKLIK